MRFWDASALVPLCVRQPSTRSIKALLRADPVIVAWWATPVECASAFARLRREGRLSDDGMRDALGVLDATHAKWSEVLPTDAVRDQARRLLAEHDLRAADALQLAAALAWAGERPAGQPVVTLDVRLAFAARNEGFEVLPKVER